MVREQFAAGFWDGLSLLRSGYCGALKPVGERFGLTKMELDILLFLANNPRFDTAAALVERRHLTKSHVSTSVQALKARGYLACSYREGDRKTVHLALCPAADEAVREGQRAQKNFFAGTLRGLSREEIKAIEAGFAKMVDNVRQEERD